MSCIRATTVWVFWMLFMFFYCSRAQTLLPSIPNNTNCSVNANSTASTNYSQCLEEEDPYESCPDPSACELSNSGDNVGLAFGLTIGAGLSTTLGAFLPFVPCIKRSNTLFLAAGLALAAGVMLYVSFTEIWTKAKLNFCCETPVHYDLVTTVCFFGGILITVILDLLVTLLQKVDCGCSLPCLTKSCCKKRSGDKQSEQKSFRLSVTNPLRRSINGVKHHSNGLIPPPSESEPSTSGSLHQDSEIDIDLHSTTDGNHDNPVTPSNEGNDDVVSHGPSIGTCTSVLPSNNEYPPGESHNGHVITPECVSVSAHSTGISESTNNYGGASVNELFSNSSLLRMNGVVGGVNQEAVDGGGDSAIDMCTDEVSQTTSSSTGAGLRGDGVSQATTSSVGAGQRGEKASELVRRHSYQEMVDQVCLQALVATAQHL